MLSYEVTRSEGHLWIYSDNDGFEELALFTGKGYGKRSLNMASGRYKIFLYNDEQFLKLLKILIDNEKDEPEV